MDEREKNGYLSRCIERLVSEWMDERMNECFYTVCPISSELYTPLYVNFTSKENIIEFHLMIIKLSI